MSLTETDRMSAVILAKAIDTQLPILQFREELKKYVQRLVRYRLFATNEVVKISRLSEYRIRQIVNPDDLIKARAGIEPRHLDHLIQMISSEDFAKLHTKSLVDGGATYSALSRITGYPESTLRRWGVS